mmetsp:Transcript_7209/g.10362  ORF Transcript_7209/g.10362 Transcript_7209/m.10362 type:complete len:220 (+) Transcript_7209:149-808(+)
MVVSGYPSNPRAVVCGSSGLCSFHTGHHLHLRRLPQDVCPPPVLDHPLCQLRFAWLPVQRQHLPRSPGGSSRQPQSQSQSPPPLPPHPHPHRHRPLRRLPQLVGPPYSYGGRALALCPASLSDFLPFSLPPLPAPVRAPVPGLPLPRPRPRPHSRSCHESLQGQCHPSAPHWRSPPPTPTLHDSAFEQIHYLKIGAHASSGSPDERPKIVMTLSQVFRQ